MINWAKAKCYSCMNLSTACFIVAYFQLMFHVTMTATVAHMLISLAKEEPAKDVQTMARVINSLLIGQLVFPVAIVITKFTIVLIVGLHTKNRVRITSYLIFASLTLVLIAIALILVIYVMKKQLPLDLLLTVTTMYALSIFLLRKYLKQLNLIDTKPLKEIV